MDIPANSGNPRNNTSADDYSNGAKVVKQRFANDKLKKNELQKIIGDNLNKRYSSKKKHTNVRNPNIGYNNTNANPSQQMSSRPGYFNGALASDSTIHGIVHTHLNEEGQVSKLTGFNDSFDQIQDFSPKKVSMLSNKNREAAEGWHAKSPDVTVARNNLMLKQPY